MSKNKYASDFRSYMNVYIKNEDDHSSTAPNTINDKRNLDGSNISLDIWDKKYRFNSSKRYGDFLHASVHKPRINHTVKLSDFASELKMPVQLLIEQFSNAGISNLSPEILISERHKIALLDYLSKEHGTLEIKKTDPIAPIEHDILHQNNSPSSESILLTEDVNEELIYLLANNPTIMYQLGSRKFEELIAKLFSDRGHEVSLTKSTRDGGYDIWAKVKDAFSEFIILAECKKYSPDNKVGVEIVRGLYGVTEMNKANQGLIITSSFFTRDAYQEQLRIGNRIALKDYNNLVEWLKPYSK